MFTLVWLSLSYTARKITSMKMATKGDRNM